MTDPKDKISSDYTLNHFVGLNKQYTRTTTIAGTGDVTITLDNPAGSPDYDGSNYSGSTRAATYEKLTINDGTSTRVVYFSMSLYGSWSSPTGDSVDMSGGPAHTLIATRLAAAINDTSTGTAIAATAKANTDNDPATVTIILSIPDDIISSSTSVIVTFLFAPAKLLIVKVLLTK